MRCVEVIGNGILVFRLVIEGSARYPISHAFDWFASIECSNEIIDLLSYLVNNTIVC